MQYKKIILMILTIMMLVPAGTSVFAQQQGNLPIVDTNSMFSQLRMVGGGMCQDMPDDRGTPTSLEFSVWCTGPNGVTTDLKGCVAQFHDAKGRLLREDVLSPGKASSPAPVNTASWQRFNCYEAVYTCTDYESKSCGGKGSYAECATDEMLRIRTCNNAPDSIETERCIPWYECYYERCTYYEEPWSVCENSKQTREIQETDCSKRTDVQSCTSDCRNPVGHAGDLICKEQQTGSGVYYQYECNSLGNWIQGNKCSAPDSQTPDSSSDASQGQSGDNSVAKDLYAENVTAFYDPTEKKIIGRIQILNNGEDMKDTHIVEMQFAPKGEKPFGYKLSFVSSQKVCDREHPENVHKQFMLKSGESEIIQLEYPRGNLSAGEYDVFFLTRHKCYADLTPEQLENYNSYQRVGPFEDYKHVGTIIVDNSWAAQLKGMFDGGDIFKNPKTYIVLLFIGIILALIGIYFPPLMIVGIILFFVGIIGWLITYIITLVP